MTGQTIGKYRILERVGRGGMGTVYRAVDETLQRDVAIKVLNPELSDPDVATRFRNEAVTVARANHPGIATVYELFQHETQWVMVMEFVRGETLEALVTRVGPLPVGQAVQLIMQSLTGLSHAHRLGIIHRDLKPANIMVTDGGLVKIMDFGIARVVGTEHLTMSGFMMGTPAYMAPEQVLGKAVDSRADLYAMGVVLYRLATAKLPFKGDTAFLMAQSQVNDAPVPLRVVREGLPIWLDPVMDRALAKNPDSRFQTADEFRASLERHMATAPTDSFANPAAAAGGAVPLPPPSPVLDTTPPKSRLTEAPPPPVTASDTDLTVAPGTASRPTASSTTPSAASASPAAPAATRGDAATYLGATPPPPTGARPVVPPSTAASSTASSPAAVASPPSARVPKPDDTVTLKKRHLAYGGAGLAAGLLLVAALAAYLTLSPEPLTEPPADTTTVVDPALPAEPTIDPSAAPPVAAPVTSVAAGPLPGSTPPGTATPPLAPGGSIAARPPGAPATPPPSAPAVPLGTAPPVPAPAPPAIEGPGTTAAESPRASSTAARKTPPPAVPEALMAFSDVKLLVVTGNRGREQDVVLNLAEGRVAVVPEKQGTVVKALPYKAIRHVTYSRSDDPRWQPGPGAPPNKLDAPGGFMGRARHWLTLQTDDDYMILRLEGSNWERIVAAVETRTGITATRR